MGAHPSWPPNPGPLFAQIDRVDSLPVITEHHLILQTILGDHHAPPDEALRAIEGDPAFAANLMRFANAADGSRGCAGAVCTIEDAVQLVGTPGLIELNSQIEVVRGFGIPSGINMQIYWDHSVNVALLARQYAQAAGADGGQAYVAGLLHDVGMLVLVRHLPETFDRLLRDTVGERCSVHSTCRRQFGCTPLELTARLLGDWRVAPDLVSVMTGLANPELCLTGDDEVLRQAVLKAHLTCEMHGGGFSWDRLPSGASQPPAALLPH